MTHEINRLIGYLDEDGCLIPIANFNTGAIFHRMLPRPEWKPIYESDLSDPNYGWTVTV